MWRRLAIQLRTLGPARSTSGPVRCAVASAAAPRSLLRPAAAFSRHFSAPGNTSALRVEDVMPIATGHEREELEAELQLPSYKKFETVNVRSGFMRFNAREWAFSCKSRSYFNGRFLSSAPRAMVAHKNSSHLIERYLPNSLLAVGIACDTRNMELEQNAERKAEETRGARYRDELLSEIVRWEKRHVSYGNSPYYIEGGTKSLVECMPLHLKPNKFRKYGGILKFSDKRLQLQSIPGNRRHVSSLVGTPRTARGTTYPKPFCEWLAGVIDGDGSFHRTQKESTSLEIIMGFEDLKLLRHIQNALGGGIKMRAGAKAYRYRLHNPRSMIKVMNCINGHIRHSARLHQLHRVCQVLEIPVVQPFPLYAQSNWFAGFFDANGMITLGMVDGLPQLSIRVTNNLLRDVEPFKVAFGGGLYFDSGRNGYYEWSIQSRQEITAMLDYFKASTFRSHESRKFFLIKNYYSLYDLEAFKPDSIHHKEWLAFLDKWNKPFKSAEHESVKESLN